MTISFINEYNYCIFVDDISTTLYTIKQISTRIEIALFHSQKVQTTRRTRGIPRSRRRTLPKGLCNHYRRNCRRRKEFVINCSAFEYRIIAPYKRKDECMTYIFTQYNTLLITITITMIERSITNDVRNDFKRVTPKMILLNNKYVSFNDFNVWIFTFFFFF